MFDVDRDDVQGIALHGYRSQPFARYHLLSFGAGAARLLLSRLVWDISSAAEPRATARHNLALTASGLRGLGLGDAELAQFSREFRQGMAHPERAAALGDRADESPQHWEFGGPGQPAIDALSMAFARSQDELAERCAAREALFDRFGITWRAQDTRLSETAHAPPVARVARRQRVPLGEFLLGQRDAVGERHTGPFVPVKYGSRPMPEWSRRQRRLDFGLNGSYLVLRKLERQAPSADAELVAMHARRALGPEPSLMHRLLRRSRSYDAGLWFMALNADIRRQFEFVQQSYFNADESVAGEPRGVDPFVGRAAERSADETRQPAGSRVKSPRLFRVRGGAYFFLPGLRALNYLAEPGG